MTEAFAALVQREMHNLRRYARSLTRDVVRADDLVQACVARALAKEHLWQPGTDMRAWLFTILHNQHVNDVRRGSREGVMVPIEDLSATMATPPNASGALELRDLDAAMMRLPIEQRLALMLIGMEGIRHEEVATILNVPVGTVRSRITRGREALRDMMGIST